MMKNIPSFLYFWKQKFRSQSTQIFNTDAEKDDAFIVSDFHKIDAAHASHEEHSDTSHTGFAAAIM
jgi:hypothetical protein